MVAQSRVALVVGFLAALFVLVGLLFTVGVDRIAAALSSARPSLLGVVVALSMAWLISWGLALYTVLGALEVDVGLGTSLVLYAVAVFANNVTPLAQAGGEPITALFISRTGRTRYEKGLAAIASLDALNVVASTTLSLIGIGVYATSVAVGPRLEVVAAITVGFALGVTVVFSSAWRYQGAIARHGGTAIAAASGSVARILPRVSPPDPADVTDRIAGVFGSVEAVVARKRRLAATLSLLALGWLLQAGALLVALRALGADVPATVLLFVVPVSNLAGVIPLPGGLGGIETALVVLLALTSGVPAAIATAAVIVFRAAVYWLPVIVGSGAAAALAVSARD